MKKTLISAVVAGAIALIALLTDTPIPVDNLSDALTNVVCQVFVECTQ
ncbi:hypothetical protein ACSTIN_04175 [Vibrio parahaemolyticus]|nr:hypothetical protein [Vibrio parahaemolyticus]